MTGAQGAIGEFRARALNPVLPKPLSYSLHFETYLKSDYTTEKIVMQVRELDLRF